MTSCRRRPYRCVYLLEQTQKPILVLCFNKALAAKLRQMLSEKGVGGDRVISPQPIRHAGG
ncbi:MAG: hypothetical protein ACFB8W_20360 [Elainellaceae cyanobacterium]